MQERSKASKKGIRLDYVNWSMFIVATILAVVLLASTIQTSAGYTRLQEATELYITSQQDVADMQTSSDYLTDQARSFVVTGEKEHADHYFEEANVTRRRDRALEDMEDYLAGTQTYFYLSTAMYYSNELMNTELYAMRLAIEGYGDSLFEYPEELAAVELSQDDLALDASAQLEKAQGMLFDEAYRNRKDRISDNVSRCSEELIAATRAEQLESSERLLSLMRRQELLILVMLVLAFALVFMTSLLLIRPIRRYVSNIVRREPLPEDGAYELRFLASTYNEISRQNQRHREQLSYDASHDSLTGLLNRSVFEKLRSRCQNRDNAMLLIDVDHFKQINDSYGHDIGDRALQRVASLLQENFRVEDYICRIGGDEFAVIMVHAGTALKGLVEEKIARLNAILAEGGDGLPPLSLSVGVAFCDRENPGEDIYKDADAAMYRVKKNGRSGVEFY